MNVSLRGSAEADLDEAFQHYEGARPGLGTEFITEFRRAVDQILRFPRAWQPLDAVYRRCRLNRFPFGVIYKIVEPAEEVVIVAVAHLSRDPRRRF